MALDLSMIPDEKPQGASATAKKSTLDLSMIPDAGTATPVGRETISTDKRPKWEDLSLWDKLTVLSNPLTMGAGLREVFKESPEDMQAKSINALAISQKLNIPASAVYQNYDKIIKDPSITGMNFSGPGRESSSPISRAYEFGEGLSKMAFPALIGAGLITNPLATLGAVGMFTGVSEGLKFGGSLATGKDYKFGMPASELLPGDSSETVKSIFDMAEFMGSALATGTLVKGWNKIIPGVRSTMAEKLFHDTITEYKAPEKVYVSPEKVRELQMGNEDVENQLIKDLDLDGAQWRQALRMGVDIEVPAEKIIRIVDKPWFAKIKQDLNKTGIFSLSPYERVKMEWAGKPNERPVPTGQPRPSALLPAPGEEATGPLTSVPLSGEPGSSSPLYQTNLQPATEALDRIKQEIQASGFDAEYAESTAALLDARSRVWAVQTGKTPADYFERWGIQAQRRTWNPRNKTRESSNLGEKKETLIGWLKQRGGVWDETLPGETAQFGPKESGMVGLVRKSSGQSFDELASHAVQDGWLPEGAPARDFIDLLSNEIRAVKEKKPEARAVKSGGGLDRDAARAMEGGGQAQGQLGEEAQKMIDAGFDYYGPHNEITAGSLEEGDRVIILGDEYIHKGEDENGAARLSGAAGDYLLKPDDVVPAEAVKKINQPIYDGKGLFQGAENSGTLLDIEKSWESKGIESSLYEKNGIITLSKIIIPKGSRNQGKGKAAIQELLDYADKTGQKIALTPSKDFGGNKGRLNAFYRSFGFRTNNDFSISEKLVRDPIYDGKGLFQGNIIDFPSKGKRTEKSKIVTYGDGLSFEFPLKEDGTIDPGHWKFENGTTITVLANGEMHRSISIGELNRKATDKDLLGYDKALKIQNVRDKFHIVNPSKSEEQFQTPVQKLRTNPIPVESGEIITSYYKNDKVKAHPDYKAAKGGDWEAAARLVPDVVKPETIEAVKSLAGEGAIFAYPQALEEAGRNAIPGFLANYYATLTGGSVDDKIIQTNRAYHTGAKAMERFISPVHFDGEVIPGGRYVLVDDVSTLGGTIAALAHHIQEGGGQVAGIIFLTNAMRSRTIVPKENVIQDIERRYGDAVREEFGIDPKALTAAEAGYLHGFRDADSLRARAAKAREERIERLRSKGIRPSETDQVDLFQGSKIPKGSLSFNADNKAVLTFFQSADLSTAPHEIFHLFLEDFHDTALTQGVPDQVKKDFQTVLDWFGVKSWDEVTTAHKERWARAGEKYLGSGKAPSVELRSVFERFKEWILSVYKALRELNVNLTKKMRGVFDRLLATEEEIQTMKAEMDIKPLWREGQPPIGISPEAWANYGELARRAAVATQEAIEKRRLEEFNEAKGKWTKDAQELYLKDVRHELMEQIVQGGGLNKEMLLREFDEATVNALSRRRPGLVRNDGKLSHEMVAFGSNDISTDQLVDTLLNTETKEEFIDNYIKTQTEEFDSEIPLGETAITDEYLAMIHKEMELLLQASTKGGPGRVPRNSEIKKRIRWETGQTRVDDLVTETDALKAGLQMAGRAAREALRAGKMEQALYEKGRQREIVMNLKAKYEAQREIDKTKAYFSRVAKSTTIDWDFKAQILDILADHEIIRRQDFPRENMPTLRKFVADLTAAGEMLDISDAMLDRAYIGPMKGRTYDQLMDIRNTVEQIEHLGRIQNKLIAEEKVRDVQEAVDEVTGKIRQYYGKKFVEPSGHLEFEEQKNILQKAGEFADGFIKELIKPEVIIRLLDGLEEMGPVWQNTFAKIKAAEDKEIVMGKDFMKRLKEVFDKIPKDQRRSWLNQKVSIPEIPEKFLTKSQMIMVALNSGNTGNRTALKAGSGPDPEQQWDDSSIQAITDKLSKEEWQLVQEVWSLINELYKPLNEVHRALTGVPLKKVEGITVKTPYGEIDGQYFPLVFDPSPKMGQKAERYMLEMAEKDMFANYYARPVPGSGFTKERVGGKMFPLLDFSVITGHINDVVHFVSNALEIRDVNKVVTDVDVRAAIEQSLGDNAYKQIGPWLRYVARSEHKPILMGEKILGWVRRNSSIVILGVKATTALMQPLASTQGIEYLGLKTWLSGAKQFYSAPIEWSNFIKERSPMMSTRYSSETLDREMAQFAKQFNPAGDSIKDLAIESFFAWMNVMDASVTYPTWMAAYKKAMDKNLWNEKKAIEYADMATRLSQSSSAVKDQALAMQGKEGAWKLFTMFQTFFNAFFNRIVENVKGFGLGTVGIGGLVSAFTWLILAPATIQYAAFERKIPSVKDVGREGLLYLSSGVPLVRDVMNVILTDFDYKASPAFGAVYEIGYLAKSLRAKDPKLKSILKHSLMLGGYAAGLPTAQAVVTLTAIFDMIEGKETNPLNLLLRKPKEEKK